MSITFVSRNDILVKSNQFELALTIGVDSIMTIIGHWEVFNREEGEGGVPLRTAWHITI